MGCNTMYGNGETTGIERQALIQQITDYCVSAHLSYNGEAPIKVSPGVWKFYAVEMNHACRHDGQCREQVYYACMLGNTIQIC